MKSKLPHPINAFEEKLSLIVVIKVKLFNNSETVKGKQALYSFKVTLIILTEEFSSNLRSVSVEYERFDVIRVPFQFHQFGTSARVPDAQHLLGGSTYYHSSYISKKLRLNL